MTASGLDQEPTVATTSVRGLAMRRSLRSRIGGEARPMIWLTAVEGVARALSFGFYVVAAHLFEPAGFGIVQYSITVAMFAFGGLQVLTTAVARELGAVRGDEDGTREVLGSSLAATLGLLVVTTLLCLVAQSLGLTKGANLVGLIAVLAGTWALQLYYAISRGLGHPGLQAASYAGASLAQLVLVGGLVLVADPTPMAALLVFGCSSFVPVLLYEWKRPVLRRVGLRVRRSVLRELWAVSVPLAAAQVCYLVWNSLDQIWIQHALGTYDVGLYASAKNLSQVLLVVSGGICGALLPRVSQLRNAGEVQAARRLILRGIVGGAVASGILALVITAVKGPLLTVLYGESYGAAAGALAVLSFGMVAYAVFAIATIAAVGWGRPHVYTAGVLVAAVTEGAALAVAPSHGLTTAAVAYSASMVLAVVFVLALLKLRPLIGTDR